MAALVKSSATGRKLTSTGDPQLSAMALADKAAIKSAFGKPRMVGNYPTWMLADVRFLCIAP